MSKRSGNRMGTILRTTLTMAGAAIGLLSAVAPAPAGGGMTFRVLDEAGKPVKGATVHLLPMGGASWTGGEAKSEPLPPPMTTGADGRAGTDGYSTSSVCALAHDGKRAAWICALTQTGGTIEFRLGEARIVSLRPVDAKGRAVKKARMRLVFPGGSEIHGIDAAEAGGVHRFPPLPLARFDGHVHVEALAAGYFVGPYELPADAGPKGAALPLIPTRTVTGRVLGPDRSPAAGARVRLANDGWDDDGVPAGPDGRFSLPGVPVGAGRRLMASAEGMAPLSVGSPGGGDDVGDIVLPEGLFLHGSVREADGVKVVRAFIAVSRGGQRVASCETKPGGAFTLGPVDEGQYEVEVYLHRSEGVAGWRCLVRTVRPGPDAVDFVVPTGLRILLRDSQGKAVTSRDVETEIAHAGRAEPWKEHFNASGEFSELRMLADPETAYSITVRVAGYAPATGTATTDAEGRADVEMRLEPGGK